jgi:hypothetical protein
MVHDRAWFSGARRIARAMNGRLSRGVLLTGAAAMGVALAPVSELRAQEKEEELPKSGSLSTSISTRNRNSTSVAEPWGGVNIQGKDASPISGSVSKTQKGYVARMFNNSEDTYSVSVRVVQLGKNDNTLKTDSFSMTLKPGQSMERPVSAAPGVFSADLKLENWRKLTDNKKKKEAPAAEGAAAGDS